MWDGSTTRSAWSSRDSPPGSMKRRRAAEIPLRRLGTAEDVAGWSGSWLQRSDYMTGQAVNVTGGLVMF